MQTAEHKSTAAPCWSCGAPLAGAHPLCAHCDKVQPLAPDADYFAAFALPRKLGLDVAALEHSFYRLSRKLHPDLFVRASMQEQQASLEQTSLLNDAYRTLKSPVSRTEYLLGLEGVKLDSDRSADGQQQSRVPADLLEEVFELNMQLEEMRMSRKMGEDDPALRGDLERAKTQFESQLAACDDDLKSLWADWDSALDRGAAPEATAGTKEKMVALLDRRRYLRNLVRDVDETLEA